VITLDREVGDFPVADVLIEDGTIISVGPNLSADGAEVIEAESHIVLPGFIDTHRHNWQSITHQVGADWTLADYFQGFRGMMGEHFTPEDLRVANLFGRIEALNSGITTMVDWSHLINSPEHADAAIEGLDQSGGRSVFAYGDSNAGWNPLPSEIPISEDARRVKSEHFSSDDQLTTMAMALRGPNFAVLDVTEHDWLLARDIDCRITTHVGDGLWGITYKAMEMLESRNLLGDDTTYIHCNTTTDYGLQLIADTGGTASVAAPIEMLMGHGFPATNRLLALGVRPSLSIDVVSVASGDMFSVMRAALTCARALDNDVALKAGTTLSVLDVTTRDILEFATVEGARATGLDRKIGTLTPGKQADLILIRTDSPAMWPMSNPVGAVVMTAQVADVETVLVAGEVVKRGGEIVSVDMGKLRDEAREARDRILTKSGLEGRFLDWQLEPMAEWTGAAE
jgi:5-methylthioadenosine/S-adenosylhomocysteine deaminase